MHTDPLPGDGFVFSVTSHEASPVSSSLGKSSPRHQDLYVIQPCGDQFQHLIIGRIFFDAEFPADSADGQRYFLTTEV